MNNIKLQYATLLNMRWGYTSCEVKFKQP